MKKNYYDVLVFNEDTGLNEELLKKVSYEVANLKVLALRNQGKKADIWYNFHKYSTTEITKDNIHLYYEFISDDDLNNYEYSNLLNYIFTNRLLSIYRIINNDKLVKKNLKFKKFNNWFIALNLFNVKDTLKPIDEYIEEIKSSDAYKEYIKCI